MAVSDYNSNPALNTAVGGIDISEGSPASGYNDALRAIMADIRSWTDGQGVTYPIAVTKGGTGAITAPLALAALGGLGIAYQGLPQVAKSAAFSLTLDMSGGHVRFTGSAAAATINPNSTTAFPVGAVVLLVNDGSGALTITRGAGVALVWASSGSDANRALAVGGMASMLQVATDRWFVSGAGLS